MASLDGLTHPYTLLVSIPADPGLPTTISYWAPPSFRSCRFQLRTTLKPGQIHLLQLYEDHGIVRIAAREPDLVNFLGHQIELLQTSSQDAQMGSKIVTKLRCDETDEGVDYHVFSIQVLGDDSGNLVANGCNVLWKWVKPLSPYRKSGFWCHSLTKVLEDADWTAGKGVSIIAKSVGEEEYESVVKGEKKM